MDENDMNFMLDVACYFIAAEGNLKETAEHFRLSRAKTNKILVTMKVLTSDLIEEIGRMRKGGMAVDEIAERLGVSETMVKCNMPYEKAIYNGPSRSLGAIYQEKYKKREKVFSKKVNKGKPGAKTKIIGDEDPVEPATKGNPLQFDIEEHDQADMILMSYLGDFIRLHVALEAYPDERKELDRLAEGKNGITRDIIVPTAMPLHNLH